MKKLQITKDQARMVLRHIDTLDARVAMRAFIKQQCCPGKRYDRTLVYQLVESNGGRREPLEKIHDMNAMLVATAKMLVDLALTDGCLVRNARVVDLAGNAYALDGTPADPMPESASAVGNLGRLSQW